jgi:peptide/nickel transport system substrate-binding protein
MKLRFLHPTRPKISLIGHLVGSIENRLPSDRLILRILFFTCIGSLVSAAILFNNSISAESPVPGGTIVEGVIGTPRFVNPALAVTRADLDITALIFSGLMEINAEGTLVPDLAESITMSDDGKTYNIIIKNNLRFHDDTPLTARDVAFTIGLIQNSELKSPLRGNWSDVTVEEIGEYELNIILSQSYTPFIENFTVGILPKHIWSTIPIEQVPFSELNTQPIGSGPFMLDKVILDEGGLITSYTLKSFSDNKPVILDGIEVHFYQNEDELTSAFQAQEISSTAQLPVATVTELLNTNSYQIIREPLPRVFAVFFNQNRTPALRDTAVRLALTTAIDRDILVDTALSGFGVPITTPIPPNHPAVESTSQITGNSTSTAKEKAESILTRAGWSKTNSGVWEKRIDGEMRTLSITLKAANTSAYEETIEVIARTWRDLGVTVQIEVFEQSDLLQAVIRPRDFESLLFGIDMNRSVDLYPFWHSSQREDPGLNIAQYANIEVDKLLDMARTATSTETQTTLTRSALQIIARETPAAFLYVPELVYVLPKDSNVADMKQISKPQDRFMNVHEWSTATDTIWPIFKNN